MASDTHICTHCGYEGKPVRPPNDETYKANDTGKSLDRVANLLFPGLGMLIRPLAMFLVLPIYMVLWPVKRLLVKNKHCSDCGLPLMVKLSSDAGWIAKRKRDIKEGLVTLEAKKESPLAFGKEIKLPGEVADGKTPAPAPIPEKLPALDVLLSSEAVTKKDSVTAMNTAEPEHEKTSAPLPVKPKKEDEW